jgi:hypothetical protein
MERINVSPNAVPITPSDSTVYTPALVGIFVGGAGNVTIKSGGQLVLLTGILAGQQLNVSINQVMATGTTATLLTGFQWPE